MLGIQKISVLFIVLLALVTVAINKETVKVEWIPGDNLAQWYEVRTRWRDKTEATYFSSFRVNEPTHAVVVPKPRSGHFAVEIRACRKYPEDLTADQCSSWTRSDVEGVDKDLNLNPWEIFWKPQGPSGFFIIEEEEMH